MNLPRIDELDVFGQRILLRMDTDVPFDSFGSAQDKSAQGKPVIADDTRLRASIPTVKYLIEEGCESIVVLGHRGRPHFAQGAEHAMTARGKPGADMVKRFSLAPVAKHLEKLLEKAVGKKKLHEFEIQMAENLRFNPGEESFGSFDSAQDKSAQDKKNSNKYTEELAKLGDIYINDAFGSCGREHASIVGLPRILPSAAGFSVLAEVEALEKVIDGAEHPVVFVLGGGKGEKALFVDRLLEYADWVLVGGLLPKTVTSYCKEGSDGVCVSAAHLTPQGHDITPDSAKNFAEIITDAKTIVWGGPMGDIDNGYWDGTEIVCNAIVSSGAYKVAGGGDTIHAINELGIADKFDHISTGGGAMLEFLAYGDLPGLRVLRESV